MTGTRAWNRDNWHQPLSGCQVWVLLQAALYPRGQTTELLMEGLRHLEDGSLMTLILLSHRLRSGTLLIFPPQYAKRNETVCPAHWLERGPLVLMDLQSFMGCRTACLFSGLLESPKRFLTITCRPAAHSRPEGSLPVNNFLRGKDKEVPVASLIKQLPASSVAHCEFG